MSKNKNSGLGRGLDSLIPNDYYDEDFDANSTQSLEDMLNEANNEESEIINNDLDDDSNENDVQQEEEKSTEVSKEDKSEETVEEASQEETDEKEEEVIVDSTVQNNVDEVMEIVHKNPRITLWSVHSSAVFRYLRKTQPEFSISNEASSLIDEAVSKKYPEIWKLFEDKI
ncbi:hypothetical protein [Methanobrevibacter sp.]